MNLDSLCFLTLRGQSVHIELLNVSHVFRGLYTSKWLEESHAIFFFLFYISSEINVYQKWIKVIF